LPDPVGEISGLTQMLTDLTQLMRQHRLALPPDLTLMRARIALPAADPAAPPETSRTRARSYP
ncbi:hypothetical protein ACSHWI_16010, partial [Methylococcus sp. S2T]|uniref:hypothetical protein n=1 Tax=Methylococcus sp. S2T TaxID=3438967 RepID=UPI003ED865F7